MAFFRFPELDPVSGLLTLQRELERVFERPLGLDLGPSGQGVYPAVNVFSDSEGYVVTPGPPVRVEAPVPYAYGFRYADQLVEVA